MNKLESTPTQLQEDLAALEQAAALALELEDAATAQQAKTTAQEMKTALAVKRTEIITELTTEGKAIDAAFEAATARVSATNQARQGLTNLVQGNRRLFIDEYDGLL